MPETVSDEDALEYFRDNNYSMRGTARSLGIGIGRMRGIIRRGVQSGKLDPKVMQSRRASSQKDAEGRPEPREKESRDHRDDGSTKIELITHEDLRTQEDVVRYCEIDLKAYRVRRCKIVSQKQGQKDADKNPRIVSWVNVTLELEPRQPDNIYAAKDEVVDFLRSHAPRVPKIKRRTKCSGDDGVCMVVSCPDIHVGKLSDPEETGEGYNIPIAERLYKTAMHDLLGRAASAYSGRIREIVNIPGNDLLHFAGGTYATTSGTRQDASGTWQQAYKAGRKLATDGVLMCREVAPTFVYSIEDNHSRYESLYIADALDAYFHRDDQVTVDASPGASKFHRFGDVLLGMNHGDCMKPRQLVGEMVDQRQRDFAECVYRDWLLGHLHKEMLEVDTEMDTGFRRLPSLCGADAWHARMGFRGRKSAVLLVYDKRSLIDAMYHTPEAGNYTP